MIKIKSSYFDILLLAVGLFLACLTNFGNNIFQKYIYLIYIYFLISYLAIHKNKSVNKYTSAFVVIMAILLLITLIYMKSSDVINLLSIFLILFIGFNFAQNNHNDNESVYLLLKCIFILIYISCIYALIEIAIGSNYLDEFAIKVYNTSRIYSFFLHPIVFANILLMELVLNYAVIKNKYFRIINYIFFTFLLIYSQTRSAWILAIIFAVLLYLYSVFKKFKDNNYKIIVNKKKFFIVCCVLFFVLILILLLINPIIDLIGIINERMDNLGDSFSLTYRQKTINALLSDRFYDKNIFDWLFGCGFSSSNKALGSMGIYLYKYGNFVTDNQVLNVWYDFGILGFGIVVYYFFKCIVMFAKAKNRIAQALSLLFLVNISMSLIYESFSWVVPGFLIFLFWGLNLGIYKKDVKNKHKNPHILSL